MDQLGSLTDGDESEDNGEMSMMTNIDVVSGGVVVEISLEMISDQIS